MSATPGRPPFRPTEQQRRVVRSLGENGVPQEEIAAVIGIDPKTLRLHFRPELDVGAAVANAKMAERLFNKGIAGDTTAMIFWLKCNARWCTA